MSLMNMIQLAEVDRLRRDISRLEMMNEALVDAGQEVVAQRDLLREALLAMREVASVSHGGDPWYCENEDIDVDKAFALARTALGEQAEVAQ